MLFSVKIKPSITKKHGVLLQLHRLFYFFTLFWNGGFWWKSLIFCRGALNICKTDKYKNMMDWTSTVLGKIMRQRCFKKSSKEQGTVFSQMRLKLLFTVQFRVKFATVRFTADIFCGNLRSPSLHSLATGSESRPQSFHEAVNVAERVVERHWSDSQHAGLPHVTLSNTESQS